MKLITKCTKQSHFPMGLLDQAVLTRSVITIHPDAQHISTSLDHFQCAVPVIARIRLVFIHNFAHERGVLVCLTVKEMARSVCVLNSK